MSDSKRIVCSKVHFIAPGARTPYSLQTNEDPNEDSRFFARAGGYGQPGYQIEVDPASGIVWLASRIVDAEGRETIGPWKGAPLSSCSGFEPVVEPVDPKTLPKINDIGGKPAPVKSDAEMEAENAAALMVQENPSGKPTVDDMIAKAVGKKA